MPLTTRHQDGRRIDSTDDDQWAEVHVAGYTQLFCPECKWRMHAVDGGEARVRHFAHNAGRPDTCSLTALESPEHLATKAAIAAAVRGLNGWEVEIESPGGDYVVDVLAISPSGDRRIAFEVQFSGIHESVATERTERHRAAGLETVWLDAKGRSGLASLPTARLFHDANASKVGIQEFVSQRGRWLPRRVMLQQFVHQVCLGQITHDQFWASVGDYDAWCAYLDRRERERAEAVRNAEAVAEFKRKHAEEQRQRAERALSEAATELNAQEEQRQRAEQVRRDELAQRGQEIREQDARRQREFEERRTSETEERRAREVERERVLGPWHIPSRASNEDVLALSAKYAVAEKPFPEWILIGDRLHAELSVRGLLHD